MTTLLAALCCILWGSAAPFIKLGYRTLRIAGLDSILTFAGIRFIAAGTLVLLFLTLQTKQAPLPKKKDWPAILVLALLQTAGQYWFYYVGVSLTTGVQAAVLTGTGAFIALLASVYLFRYETMTWQKAAGCALGFAGVLVMNGFALTGIGIGTGMLLTSQIFAAASAGMIKHYGKTHNPILLSGWQFILGGLILMTLGHTPIQWNTEGTAILLWLALVSGIAYTLWSRLLQKADMSRITIFEGLIPLAGVFFSAILLNETTQAISHTTILALILTITGIWLVNKKQEVPQNRPIMPIQTTNQKPRYTETRNEDRPMDNTKPRRNPED